MAIRERRVELIAKMIRPLRLLLYFAALAVVMTVIGFLLDGWQAYLAAALSFVVMTLLAVPLALAQPPRREQSPAFAGPRRW
jgi:hypothetical protein